MTYDDVALSGAEVQVWQVRHDIVAVWDDLSEDEVARAREFAVERDRARYVAVRWALRAILADALAVRPIDVRFRYGARGKPALAAQGENPVPHFNVSHGSDLSLVAIWRGQEIGVDVERIDPRRDVMAVARRFFPAPEVARLVALSDPGARAAGFYRSWVRREALAKALGSGLREAALAEDVGPDTASVEGECWRFLDLDVGPRYAAALAVSGGSAPRVRYLSFT